MGLAYLPDKVPKFGVDLRSPGSLLPTLPRPVRAKAATVPGDKRLRFHYHKRILSRNLRTRLTA